MSLVVAGALGSGCSTSSSSPSGIDSGSHADVLEPDAGDEAGGASCNPYTFNLCPQGQTCCFAGLGGTCTPVGACNSPFQVGCVNTGTCRYEAGDEGVCCASVQFSAVDAAAFAVSSAVDAGPYGYGFTVTLACETRCTFPQLQVCLDSKDCQNGEVCTNISRTGQQPVFTCLPPDAGSPSADASPEDASPAESGGFPDAAPMGSDASDGGSDASDAGGDASDAGGEAPSGG